jgi:hypothetical protein
LLAAGVVGAALAATASPASADAFQAIPLNPGQSACVSQYAGYQVRADGTATGGGARFKLLKNGAVIDATPGRVGFWQSERRTAYGTFTGAGYYSACAYNTGDTRTTVTLRIRTDGEFA